MKNARMVEAGPGSVNKIVHAFTSLAVARSHHGFYTVETTIHALSSGEQVTMSSLDVQYVQERLTQAKCAVCKKSRFGIDSRSMKEDGEWKGICLDCYYNFPVYTDMEFYLRIQPDVQYWLKEITCPLCSRRGVTLDFRIVMSVRESRYFVTCEHCHHSFTELSYLEVFE